VNNREKNQLKPYTDWLYVHALKDKKDERARERIDSIFFFEEDNPGETRVFRDPGNSITILSKYEENMKGDCGLKHLSDETMIAGRYTQRQTIKSVAL